MNAEQKGRLAEIVDMIEEYVEGDAVGYKGNLQELLDKYAALRLVDREAELVTQIHQAMQNRAQQRTRGSLLEHARAIAEHIVKSGFPGATR